MVMIMSDLLPCPFCGGQAHHIKAVNGSNLIYTGCKSCRVRYETTYGKHGYFDTVTAWNIRAMQWQPIEMYKREYGRVLVWAEKSRYHRGGLTEAQMYPSQTVYPKPESRTVDENTSWSWRKRKSGGGFNPTHWQPRLQPPEENYG